MKKLTALICIVSMLCAFALSAVADTNPQERDADIFDALEILKELVGITPNNALELTGKEDLSVFDALEILKGLVSMSEPIKVYVKNPATTETQPPVIEYEPKVYCNVTIDQDFAGDCVLVVMDKKLSEVNKVHDPSFFGDFPIQSILDLTAIDENIVREIALAIGDTRPIEEIMAEKIAERQREENFRQILSIRLPTDDKQNVIDVIKILEKVDGVRSAEPNYYGTFI